MEREIGTWKGYVTWSINLIVGFTVRTNCCSDPFLETGGCSSISRIKRHFAQLGQKKWTLE